jgi:hypothetical protein
MPLPGMEDFGLSGRVVRLALREEDAAATLAQIAPGELGPPVLPWVAGMSGSAALANIAEWERLADLELNPEVRLNYAADALQFSELQGVRGEWKQTLEGWNVNVSQQVLEWQAITRREVLVRLLERRCKAPVPSDLAEDIRTTQDTSVLMRWFDAAAEANTYDDFRAAMQPRN